MKRQDFCVPKAGKKATFLILTSVSWLALVSFTYYSMLRPLGSMTTSWLHPAGHPGCTPNPSHHCTHAQAPCSGWRPQGSCWEEQESGCLSICHGEVGIGMADGKTSPEPRFQGPGSDFIVPSDFTPRAQTLRLKHEEFHWPLQSVKLQVPALVIHPWNRS